MKILIFLFLLATISCRSQFPDYIQNWNYIPPDTITRISGTDTCYSITAWWLKKGNELNAITHKNAVRNFHYFVNSDKKYLWQEITVYQSGNRISSTTLKKSGTRKEIYDKKGNILTVQLSPDKGKSFYKLLESKHHSSNKKITTFYYPNGVIRAQGKERRARIIAGCDSGLHVFVKCGTWSYYNEDGTLRETKKEVIKTSVYEPVGLLSGNKKY